MKIQKPLTALAVAALMCGSLTATAYGRELLDMDRPGSISASMAYDGQAVGGGSLTLYQAGDIYEGEDAYSFTLSEDFAASGISLEDISSEETADSLAEYAQTNGLTGTQVSIGEDGQVSVEDLELGLYLIVQDEPAQGYEAISPFLVSVPMYEDGVYVYDVNAEPKMSTLTQTPQTPETPGTDTTPEKPKTPVSTSRPVSGRSVTTARPATLPQTGQLNWPIPVLTVLGLCLFYAGWEMRFGRKRKRDEA